MKNGDGKWSSSSVQRPNGNEISASEMIKRREQQVKENNKRDNNL